jgi:hypothetical protein
MVKSRYLRTTSLIRAKATLALADSSRIRNISQREADRLAEMMAKRNPFVKKRIEGDFYYNRARELGCKTVVEVLTHGSPSATINEAVGKADLIEKLAVLASTLTAKRKDINRHLDSGGREPRGFDLMYGTGFSELRSRKRVLTRNMGIEIDDSFAKRFAKNGFGELYSCCSEENPLSRRLSNSAGWLYESLVEPRREAAVVKAAIGLESLLVFSETEPLTRTLSERAAFLLSQNPRERAEVSQAVKLFYNVRSAVVHGGRKKLRDLRPGLLDGVTRLAVLLYLTISHNRSLWATDDALRVWCEDQRWSAPLLLEVPYRKTYLHSALSLVTV